MAGSIGTAFVDVKFDDAQVKQQLSGLNQHVESSARGFDTLGDRGAKGLGQVEKSTGRLRSGLGSLGGALKGTAGILGVGLGAAAAVKGFEDVIGAASDLNEQVNKTKTVFGPASKDVQNWSKNLTQSFGLSQRAALEFSGVFGNMLRPMGFAPKAAADMSKSLTQLGGDMASFNNASIDDTLEAIRSGLSGETEPLRKYGVFLNDARVQAEALSSGLVKGQTSTTQIAAAQLKASEATQKYNAAVKAHGENSAAAIKAAKAQEDAQNGLTKAMAGHVPKLTAAQKAQATYNLIMKDTAAAQGDFAKTSDGVANAQRVASANWENLQAKIGQMFLPAVASALGLLNKFLTFVTNNFPVVQQWFDRVMKGEQFQQLKTAAQQAVAVIGPAIQTLIEVVKELEPVWRTIGGAWLGELKGMMTSLQGFVQIVSGIVKLVKALLEGDWSAAWAAAKQIVNGFVTYVRGLLQTFVAMLKGVVGLVGIAAKAIGKALLDAIVSAGTNILNAARKLGSNIVNGLKAGAQALPGVVAGVISAAANAVVTAATNLGRAALAALGNAIRGGANVAKAAMQFVADYVLTPIRDLETKMFNLGRDIVMGLVHGIEKFAHHVYDAARNLASKALGILKGPLGFITGSPSKATFAIGEDVTVGLAKGIEGSVPKAVQAAIDLANKTLDAMKTRLTAGVGQLNAYLQRAFQAKQGAEKTPAEKRLEELQRAQGKSTAASDMAQANAQLAEAIKASTTPTTEMLKAVADAEQGVTEAQTNLNAAVAEYGPDSQQARDAATALAEAQQGVVDAQAALPSQSAEAAAALQAVTDAQDKLTTAIKEHGAASKQAAAAQKEVFAAQAEAQQVISAETPGDQQARDQAVLDAQTQRDDLLYAQEQAALEKRAELERKELEGRQFVRQQAFEKDLAALNAYLESGRATVQESNRRIRAFMDRFGIDFKEMGSLLGTGFTKGLQGAIASVDSLIESLRKKIQQVLQQLRDLQQANAQVQAASSKTAPKNVGAVAPAPAPGTQGAASGGTLYSAPTPLAQLQAAMTSGMRAALPELEPGPVFVTVRIGETELRTLVRSEVSASDQQTARALLAGVRR